MSFKDGCPDLMFLFLAKINGDMHAFFYIVPFIKGIVKIIKYNFLDSFV